MKEVKSNKVRLDRFLSSQNIAARKDSSKLIRRGAVTVDGITVKDPGQHIDAQLCRVEVNGVAVEYRKYIYLMMNKPAGVLSASRDSHAKTVLDILPDAYVRRGLFPAGRLDKDTTGLLIITDDGEYSHKMLHPKKHVSKLYRAKLRDEVTQECAAGFSKGVLYEGISYMPARLDIEDEHHALVEIQEGKYHQVKKMFQAYGNFVEELMRLSIGSLDLDKNLNLGDTRIMTAEEAMLVFDGIIH